MTIIDKHHDVIKELYKLGFVSCNVFEQNDIYKDYLSLIDNGVKKFEAVQQMTDKYGFTEAYIYRILKRFKQV